MFYSSVALQTAWVINRHPLGSSGSCHALHKLIVLSIGNLCRSFRGSPSDGCLFSDLLVHLRQTLVSFCENGPTDTLQNSRRKKRKPTKLGPPRSYSAGCVFLYSARCLNMQFLIFRMFVFSTVSAREFPRVNELPRFFEVGAHKHRLGGGYAHVSSVLATLHSV